MFAPASMGRTWAEDCFEFRLRKNLEQILGQASRSSAAVQAKKKAGERVLLRLFCHAYGNKRILLLSGYDKGRLTRYGF